MKNLILSSALGGVALLLSACGDTDADERAGQDQVLHKSSWGSGRECGRGGDR